MIQVKDKRILVVMAHPDDADYYCGGIVAKWAGEGAEIKYLICTDGAVGTSDPQMTTEKLAAIRQAEQLAANKVLGVTATIFLDNRDLTLRTGDHLRKSLARQYRIHKPHILMTFDPWVRHEIHPDHTAAGFEAIYARGGADLRLPYPDLLDEGLEPWHISDLLLFKTNYPNIVVDTENYIERKLDALACHDSQFGPLVADRHQGLHLLREISARDPQTGRICETLKHIALDGFEGLRDYVAS